MIRTWWGVVKTDTSDINFIFFLSHMVKDDKKLKQLTLLAIRKFIEI